MLNKSILLTVLVILILIIGHIGRIQAGAGVQEIISSFENLVKEVEKTIKSFPETVVYRGPDDGYRKEKIVFKSISYDIQKTDSLISPYKGIIEFETYWEFGPELYTASQAERSEPNKRVVHKNQVVYSYQNDEWVKKYVKSWSVYRNSWDTYTMDQLANEYFKKGCPYLSLFPKLYFTIK